MLIPVSGPAFDQQQKDAAPDVPRRKSTYFTPVFFAGLPLGFLAAIAFGVSIFFSWWEIPMPPGSELVRAMNVLLDGTEAALGVAPSVQWKYWFVPLPLVLLAIASVWMPREWLRGIFMIATATVASAFWMFAVWSIQNEMVLWSPLARYIESPSLYADWKPGPPSLGLGIWIMAAAIGLLFVGAVLNFRRQPSGVVFSICLFGCVACICSLFASGRLSSGDMDFEVKVAALEPSVRSGGFSSSTSDVMLKISLVNHSSRPLVIVPADEPPRRITHSMFAPPPPAGAGGADGESPPAEPGAWVHEWGRPDLVLRVDAILLNGASPEKFRFAPVFNGNRDSGLMGLVVGHNQELGRVVHPDETLTVTARFSPVWKQGRVPRETLAGKWKATFLDADQQTVLSEEFVIPAIVHPADQRVDDLLEQLQTMTTDAEAQMRALRVSLAGGVSGDDAVQPIVERLGKVQATLEDWPAVIRELERAGVEPPEAVKQRSDMLRREVGAIVEPVRAFLLALEQGHVARATDALEEFLESEESRRGLGPPIAKLLPRMILPRIAELVDDGENEAAINLLIHLDDNVMPDPTERARAAALIDLAVNNSLRAAWAGLVSPDGTYGLGLPPTGDVVERPPERRPIRVGRLGPRDFGHVERPRERQPYLAAPLLLAAIERCGQWHPDMVEDRDFTFRRLLVLQHADQLETESVEQFAISHADYRREEISCYLAMRALEAEQTATASDRFSRVADSLESSPYTPLARLGAAMIPLKNPAGDLLEQVRRERDFFNHKAARPDWGKSIVELIPTTLCSNLADTEWMDGITWIADRADLAAWKAGDRDTIPWVITGGSPKLLSDDVRELAFDGEFLFVDGPLFKEVTHIRSLAPPAGLLRGDALPVKQWRGQRLGYSFLKGISTVPYDVSETQTLISAKQAQKDEDFEPFLYLNDDWIVAATRMCPNNMKRDVRGAIVALPDSFGAHKDACHFLRELVKFVLASR